LTQPVGPSAETFKEALYDLALLRRLSRYITEIREAGQPQSKAVTTPAGNLSKGPLLLLPGAFNPPTMAHLALALASLRAIPGAQLSFTLGTTTINKEQTERAILLDRLLLLDQIARRVGNLGVMLTNRGLYVEQAAAARAAFPQMTDLYFVVGYDKIEQIFDARYYHDRDAALTALFSLAKLLVAPRASHEEADVNRLLNRPENRAFQGAIRLIPFPVEYRDIASSQVRAAFQNPTLGLAALRLAELLPPESLAFALETGCYAPPTTLPSGKTLDRYAIRAALLERILVLPSIDQSHIDFHKLFALATSDNERGRALRRWLSQSETAPPPFAFPAAEHHLSQQKPSQSAHRL
jgi:nicotinic acid mononucleotide adenylyltransferase